MTSSSRRRWDPAVAQDSEGLDGTSVDYWPSRGTSTSAGLTGLGLARVGVTDWLAALLTGNVTAGALPWVAGLATPLLTQLANGPAASVTVSMTLFPIAAALDYNSPILARIIAGTADAVTLPGPRRSGRDVRVWRRRTRDDVQGRHRRHHPDIDRRGRAEHRPGAGATWVPTRFLCKPYKARAHFTASAPMALSIQGRLVFAGGCEDGVPRSVRVLTPSLARVPVRAPDPPWARAGAGSGAHPDRGDPARAPCAAGRSCSAACFATR